MKNKPLISRRELLWLCLPIFGLGGLALWVPQGSQPRLSYQGFDLIGRNDAGYLLKHQEQYGTPQQIHIKLRYNPPTVYEQLRGPDWGNPSAFLTDQKGRVLRFQMPMVYANSAKMKVEKEIEISQFLSDAEGGYIMQGWWLRDQLPPGPLVLHVKVRADGFALPLQITVPNQPL